MEEKNHFRARNYLDTGEILRVVVEMNDLSVVQSVPPSKIFCR